MSISIGIKTNTHVLICSESTRAQGIMKQKEDDDRIIVMKNVMLNVSGEQADEMRVSARAVEYSKLLSLSNKVALSAKLVGNVVQDTIYSSLRKNPVKCTAVVGGTDGKSCEVLSVDGHGALHRDNVVVTGYGVYFLLGIVDAYYSPDMGEQEIMHFARLCLNTLKKRMIIENDRWIFALMNREGHAVKQSVVLENE
ncbi:20S proteasome subunit beta 4 [Enteropsectra breve]|nr:20S proteasome subunit beta 4 [Enteropsectra breve]